MGVTTYDVVNARVGPDVGTAGLNMAAKRLSMPTAGASTDFTVDLPVGATLNTILFLNPAAATGAPTNANVSVGKTVGGAEFVAAVDLKAVGKTALTFASTNIADVISLPATAGVRLSGDLAVARVYFRIAFVGGTAPAMTPTVIVEYTMPYTAPADGRGL